jgi:hypothetical protein
MTMKKYICDGCNEVMYGTDIQACTNCGMSLVPRIVLHTPKMINLFPVISDLVTKYNANIPTSLRYKE